MGSACTLTRAKIEANIPRKRGAAAAGYDKAMDSFYDKVIEWVAVQFRGCDGLAWRAGQVRWLGFAVLSQACNCPCLSLARARGMPIHGHAQPPACLAIGQTACPLAHLLNHLPGQQPAHLPPPLPCPASQVFGAVVRHVDWEVVRCLVIAGPGFAKDHFRGYLDKGGSWTM